MAEVTRSFKNAWIREAKATRGILHDVATRARLLSRGRQSSETVTNRNEI